MNEAITGPQFSGISPVGRLSIEFGLIWEDTASSERKKIIGNCFGVNIASLSADKWKSLQTLFCSSQPSTNFFNTPGLDKAVLESLMKGHESDKQSNHVTIEVVGFYNKVRKIIHDCEEAGNPLFKKEGGAPLPDADKIFAAAAGKRHLEENQKLLLRDGPATTNWKSSLELTKEQRISLWKVIVDDRAKLKLILSELVVQ